MLLIEAYRVVDLSNKVNDSNTVNVDFIKDKENEIKIDDKKKIIKGQYNSQDFLGSSKKLKDFDK